MYSDYKELLPTHPLHTRQVRWSRDHTVAMTSPNTARSDSSRADNSFVTAGLQRTQTDRHTDTPTDRHNHSHTNNAYNCMT